MGDKSMCKCLTSRISPHRASKCGLKKAGGVLLGASILGAAAVGVITASKGSKNASKNNKNRSSNTALSELPSQGIPLLHVENVSDASTSNNAEVVLCTRTGHSPTFVDSDFVHITGKETEPTVDEITSAFESSIGLEDVKHFIPKYQLVSVFPGALYDGDTLNNI